MRRILVATDGSSDSLEAASYAAKLAAGTKASVTVVHIAPAADFPLGTTQLGGDVPEPGPEDDVSIVKAVWEGAQAVVGGTIAAFDQTGVAVEGLVQEGDAVEEILRLIDENGYELVVLGRRGADRSDEPLGSTATAIAREARCPVLLVGSGAKDRD